MLSQLKESTELNSQKPTKSSSKNLLMISLSKFYAKKNNMTSFLNIVSGSSKISLRLLDWFVTNYSKKYSTSISMCYPNDEINNNNMNHLNVYLSYRAQLKAYSKQQFDPFRRRERIMFIYEKDKNIETTIGQLNFFRWVIEHHIVEYIQNNFTDIENDMIKTQKKITSNKSCNTKKRNEISKSFIKNMNQNNVSRIINFS